MPSKTIQHLIHEHREVEKAFQPLELLLKPEAAARPEELADAFAGFVPTFADRVLPHLHKEQEILFPALEGFLPRDIGPLAVLRGEHNDLQEMFEHLQRSSASLKDSGGKSEVVEGFLREARALATLMHDHIYKEEQVLFPVVERFISGVRDAYLIRQMEGFRAGTGSLEVA